MKHILSLWVLGNTANTISQWESVDVFCYVLAPVPSADVNLTLLTICIENSNELHDGGRTSFASQFMLAVLRQSDVKLAMSNFKGYISLSIIWTNGDVIIHYYLLGSTYSMLQYDKIASFFECFHIFFTAILYIHILYKVLCIKYMYRLRMCIASILVPQDCLKVWWFWKTVPIFAINIGESSFIYMKNLICMI